MNYYLVFVHDDVDPEIRGPFPNEEIRDDYAIVLRKGFGKDHGIYPLNIDGPGKPTIETYSGEFFMEKEE
jgi:hypothetical protein